jgi:hypothetical protein
MSGPDRSELDDLSRTSRPGKDSYLVAGISVMSIEESNHELLQGRKDMVETLL